ncbi:cell envelope integrity protein TolA [Prevotella merdae]|uniref:cell envelope integrity protein TolA n=1 Tax=Prevotella merdae TaxID=2079531 RepID=UPI0018E543BF|nr:cell envelope integrity protein TolA [Prevotella merdae]
MEFANLTYGYHIGLLNKALVNNGGAIWQLYQAYVRLNTLNEHYGFCDYYPYSVIDRYFCDNFDPGSDAGNTDCKWHNVEGSTNIIDLLDKIQNGDTAKTKELFKMVDMDIEYNKEPLRVTPYYSFKEEIDQCRNMAERKEAERKAKEEAERIAKEEAERKAKEEAERKAKEEAERKAKEEAERKAKEEAERKAKEEAERKAKEEAERIAKEEAERKAKEEAERKAMEEAERIAKEEAERIAKEEAERKAKEEAERKAKEEAERKAKEEAERKAKEETERKAKEEAERKAKEDAERKAKEDAERKAKEEAEHNSYKSLIEDFVSDIKECEYKDGIIFGKKKKIHYVANPITKRIWNAVVNKSSEADFDDNDFVPQKELGTFLENLNSYYSGKIVFEYLHKNIHALVHLQVYEKQDKNACFVYIKEEN